ncbi:MAG: hypothetical protein LBD85_04785, partial [Oscillospiraceae bacterium]|nr:hypothetical protein [Oscillospiraceae bacterium]
MKKFFAALLAAVMALSFVTTGALAEDVPDGSAENPLQIGTTGELLAFAARVNSGETTLCAELTDNITMDDWSAIGGAGTNRGASGSAKLYNATFDGKGHTLTLSKNNSEVNYVALFGILDYNAVVKNLNLIVNFAGGSFVAGVAGVNYGTISDVTVDGAIEGAQYLGGIVGGNRYTTIEGQTYYGRLYRCLNKASVSGTGRFIGGIAGGFHGIMQYCGNKGTVTGGTVGGLVGAPFSTLNRNSPLTISITDSYNAGDVDSSISYTGNQASGLLGSAGWEIAYAWETGFSAKNLFTYGEIRCATSDTSRYLIDGTAHTAHVISDYLKSYQNIYWREGTAHGLFNTDGGLGNGESNYISENYSGNTELRTLVLDVFRPKTTDEFKSAALAAALNAERTGAEASWEYVDGSDYPTLKFERADYDPDDDTGDESDPGGDEPDSGEVYTAAFYGGTIEKNEDGKYTITATNDGYVI